MTVEAEMDEAARKAERKARHKKANGAEDGAASGLTYYADCKADLRRGYTVKGVIGPDEMAVITGESACGKSWTALDLGLRVSRGMDWHGRRTRQGGVVFCASEAGRSIRGRVEAWHNYHDVAAAPFAVYTDAINLLDAVSVDRFLVALKAAKAKFGSLALVEIDTLSRAIPGGDENRPEGMTGAIGACDRIRNEMESALLLTHHLGKDGARGPRGHSSLFAAVDVELRIDVHVMTITKARDFVSGAQFPFKLEVVELGRDIDGDAVTACVALPDEAGGTAGKAAKRTKLNARQEAVLGAIGETIAANGQDAPASNHIPKGARVATLEAAINAAERTITLPSGHRRRSEVRRVIETLRDRGTVAFYDRFIWVPQ